MFYKLVVFFVRIFYIIVFRPKITGRENIPKDTGYILSGNHKSNFDPPMVVAFIKGKQMILAKRELFGNRFFAWFLRSVGATPINRDGNDISAIKKAIVNLKKGGSLILFPQGTRVETINSDDTKGGVALLSTRAKVPVVPIGIVGDWKPFRRMEMHIGEPIYFNEFYISKPTPEDLKDISQQVMIKIADLAGEPLEVGKR
jgi:1-acyl-sn-glycerol-3-phosphate acyltransferase